MNILHIVAGDLTGGAARGAYWLHNGLKECGVDSRIFTNSNIALGDAHVISTIESKKDKAFNIIRQGMDSVLLEFYPKRKQLIFSSGLFGFDFTRTTEYKEADIIHLHWVNAGFVNIRHLSKIKKPIIWTIRDMWPMTGGCHYSLGCYKYQTGCGQCEHLQSDKNYDLSKFILNRKKRYLPKKLVIVAISKWLAEVAKKSELYRNSEVLMISNNVNTEDFFPVKNDEAKNMLGLITDKKIILVGSTNLKDSYKGFDKYLDAISVLDKDRYLLCFFGKIDHETVKNTGFEYKIFGFLHDNISLRLAYSSADVFVAPSLMEAFGKTLAESMACGTPVVAFGATGLLDIVDHKENGYLAKPFDTADLATGIEWVLHAPNYEELSINAREKVLNEFDSSVVAKQYIQLYESVLEKQDYD